MRLGHNRARQVGLGSPDHDIIKAPYGTCLAEWAVGHNASRPSSHWSPPRVYPLVPAPIGYNASSARWGGVWTPHQGVDRVAVKGGGRDRAGGSIGRLGRPDGSIGRLGSVPSR
eukprot:1176694-Prorocentrum_minimum.AAC.4